MNMNTHLQGISASHEHHSVPELQITAGWDSTAICLVIARVTMLGQMVFWRDLVPMFLHTEVKVIKGQPSDIDTHLYYKW